MNTLLISAHRFWKRHEQVIRFLIAGGYNTVFGLSAFAGLYLLFSDTVHYLVIAIVANVLAITSAFFVYRYLVFKSSGPIVREYFKMYAVYAVSFSINLVLLAALVEVIALHPIAAQFVVVFVTVIISYFGHSRFTFHHADASEHADDSEQAPPDQQTK